MDNLEYLKKMKKADEDWIKLHGIKISNMVKDETGDSYRQAKALEIIAEELIRNNNYIEEYRTELKGANQIKINLDSLKRSKGFTKKAMGKIKK